MRDVFEKILPTPSIELAERLSELAQTWTRIEAVQDDSHLDFSSWCKGPFQAHLQKALLLVERLHLRLLEIGLYHIEKALEIVEERLPSAISDIWTRSQERLGHRIYRNDGQRRLLKRLS